MFQELTASHFSGDKFEPRLAIRYLGRILEIPFFWVQPSHGNYHIVLKRLFQRVRQLVEDLDVERTLTIDDGLRQVRMDVHGVDIIASALLNGAKIWDQQARLDLFGLVISDFKRLLEILCGYVLYPN